MNSKTRATLARAAAVSGCLAVLAGCGASSSTSQTTTRAQTTAATATATATAATPATAVADRRAKLPPNPGSAAATRVPTGESVLASIHAGKPGHRKPHLAGFDESNIADFMHEVDADVGAFWQGQFNQAGYRYTPVNELIITSSSPLNSACGSWTVSTMNAAYCSIDDTFYLPVGFLSYMNKTYGDAALAAVIAHENGHHVQQLLGILLQLQQGKLDTIQTELQADCLAGIWMASVYQRGDIQPNDIAHALAAFASGGDVKGTAPTTPGAHGGPQQRQAAFMQGYNSGQGAQCEVPALPTSES